MSTNYNSLAARFSKNKLVGKLINNQKDLNFENGKKDGKIYN